MHEFADLGMIRGTVENLEDAVAGETYEYTEMYAKFVEDARSEGVKEAARSFTWARAAEEIHARLYEKALEAARRGEDFKLKGVWVCEQCGNIEFGEAAPEKCKLCGKSREWFRWVD